MKLAKWFCRGFGILCAIAFLLGIGILLWKTPMSIGVAAVLICLSLCTGILIPNFVSTYGLIAGICMLVLPAPVSGIAVIVLSLAGAAANPLLYRKLFRR